jgi:hypothetical protein
MTLIRLTYFSRNCLDRSNGMGGVAEIVAISAARNLRNNITSVLVHDGRWFAQVLEGVESVISLTFERILCDNRHTDVNLVAMQPIAQRLYPAFAMAGFARGKDNDDLFRHYGEDESFDPRQMRADRLSDLIEAVVDRSMQGGTSWTTRSATSAA